MTVAFTLRPFTVSDYARMRESGILTEDDRVELIDGMIHTMSPIGPHHAAVGTSGSLVMGDAVGPHPRLLSRARERGDHQHGGVLTGVAAEAPPLPLCGRGGRGVRAEWRCP